MSTVIVMRDGGWYSHRGKYLLVNGKYHLKEHLRSNLAKYLCELECYRELLADPSLSDDLKAKLGVMIFRLECFVEIIESL